MPAGQLVCGLCDLGARDVEATACATCGGSTIFRYDDAATRQERGAPEAGIWRYRDWLPAIPEDRTISLGEGSTPLVRLKRWPSSVGLTNVYGKLEFASPTGSFKDRGASVLVSHASQLGATLICEDSSGNAGAAVAAYAAAAGIPCTIFAPTSVTAAKLLQMRAYGATILQIEGPRAAAEQAALDAALAPSVYYAGHNANPYFVEGCKTLGFELSQAFAGHGPDHVVMPVGGGSLFVGVAAGFAQWRNGGLPVRVPRMHLVQAEGCMPLVAAYRSGASRAAPVARSRTVAGGIEIDSPARGELILRQLRATGGAAVAVSDAEILDAQRELAQSEGIFMEPTSAAAFAGLARLASLGLIGREESVVVAVTGTGLKDLGSK